MQGRPAKILNIASTAGITARPGWVAYAASKAAVVSLSQTLSEELAGTGIKVYSISPGRTATELRRKLAPEEDPTRRSCSPMPSRTSSRCSSARGSARSTDRTSSSASRSDRARAGPMNRVEHALSSLLLRVLGMLFDLFPVRRRVVLATARVVPPRGQPGPPPRGDSAGCGRSCPWPRCWSRTATGSSARSATCSGSCAGLFLLRTSSLFVVDNAYLPVHVAPHRRATTVVQVWHAVGALKRFGADTTTGLHGPERHFLHHHYDFVVCAGEASREPYAAALRTPVERVLPLGVPRTDFFFDPEAIAAARERVLARYPRAARRPGGPLRADVPGPRPRQARRARVRRGGAPRGTPAGRRPRAQEPPQSRSGAGFDGRLRRRHRSRAGAQRGLRRGGRPRHRLLVVDLRVGAAPPAARPAHRPTSRPTSATRACTSTREPTSSASASPIRVTCPRRSRPRASTRRPGRRSFARQLEACDGQAQRPLRRAVPAGLTDPIRGAAALLDRSPPSTTSSRTCPRSSPRSRRSACGDEAVEILAVDDGSTDGSLDLLARVGADEPLPGHGVDEAERRPLHRPGTRAWTTRPASG